MGVKKLGIEISTDLLRSPAPEIDPVAAKLCRALKESPKDELSYQIIRDDHVGQAQKIRFAGFKAFLLKIPYISHRHAMRQNRLEGLAHAKRRAVEATPARLSPAMDAQSIDLQFEIRKIVLPNGKKRLALFVNNKPWHFQPHENDQPLFFTAKEAFFLTHDITGHFLTSRARTVHLPNPGGEYMTGHFSKPKQLIPNGTPEIYDGLIANAAEHMVRRRTEAYPSGKLEDVLQYLCQDDIPVGSVLKLQYKLPPADLTYESIGTSEQKIFFPLGRSLPTDVVPCEEIAGLETHLKAELANIPNMSFLENAAKESYSYTKPVTGSDLAEVYEFCKPVTPGSGLLTCTKYFKTALGKNISCAEGELIKAGYTGVTLPSGRSVYTIPNQTGHPDVFRFDALQGSDTQVSSCETNLKPVYTGQPYQSPQLTHIGLQLPEGSGLVHKLRKKFNRLSLEYQRHFNLQQKYIRQILESGTLPLDVSVIPFNGMQYYSSQASYLDLYNVLVKKRYLPAGSPITVRNIQEGMFKQWKKEFECSFNRPLGELEDEPLVIPPFPPPPFTLKHRRFKWGLGSKN
jgi:hypothetical protein